MRSTSAPPVARLDSLDYLRGLAALGIMIYHVVTWTDASQPADSFLGRIGVYGVSIFYVLSGLTLQHVYFENMTDAASVRQFFIRRVFRIFPLLWLATLASIALAQQWPNLGDLFLNLTGLFGFVAWDNYFATGAWSIGNELVFYALFPIIVLAARTRVGLAVIGSILGVVYLYFAFVALPASSTLAEGWGTYVNPLNQAFLFFCGFLIGHLLHGLRASQLLVHLALWVGVLAFLLWPTSSESIDLVTGWDRIVFTAICVAICAGAYKLELALPRSVHAPLVLLGHASYSVYLLHPIVFRALEHSGFLGGRSLAVLTIVITLGAAYACYRWFEMPVNRLGRVVSLKA